MFSSKKAAKKEVWIFHSQMMGASKDDALKTWEDVGRHDTTGQYWKEITDGYPIFTVQDALFHAVRLGDVESVKKALAHGANVNHAYNCYGASLLALMEKAMPMEKAPSYLNLLEADGLTALMHAAAKGQVEIVRLLGERLDVKVNQTNQQGATALMFAAQAGNLDVVKLLIRLGANVNQVNKRGASALHSASFSREARVVKYLVRHGGADVTLASPEGLTLASLAKEDYAKAVAGMQGQLDGAPDFPPPNPYPSPNPELAAYVESRASCANQGCPRGGLKKCSGCHRVRYCGKECQKAHWKAVHKRECVAASGSKGVQGSDI